MSTDAFRNGRIFHLQSRALAGVPQEAISSPILYNIYMYVAYQPISPHTSVAEFIDDKVIFLLLIMIHLSSVNICKTTSTIWKHGIPNGKLKLITIFHHTLLLPLDKALPFLFLCQTKLFQRLIVSSI